MSWADFTQWRNFLLALWHFCNGTSGVEGTAGGRVHWRRHVSREDNAAAFCVGIDDRNGRYERLGVRMPGLTNNCLRVGNFDNLAQVHHHYPAADMLHYRQVMGDEQISNAALLLQVLQEIDDLSLNRHIQGTNRFVTNYHFGVNRKGTGNADALSLASAEFVRIALRINRVEPDGAQQFRNTSASSHRGFGELMNVQGFADDVIDGEPGVQRSIGILKDHLQSPAFCTQFFWIKPGQIFVFENDRAGSWLGQPNYGAAQGCFTAATLPDQPERFPGLK